MTWPRLRMERTASSPLVPFTACKATLIKWTQIRPEEVTARVSEAASSVRVMEMSYVVKIYLSFKNLGATSYFCHSSLWPK